MDNADVVRLVEAGVSPGTVVAAIKASACLFDLSPEALISLTRSKVPDAVIAAMLQTKAAQREQGLVDEVFLVNSSDQRRTRIDLAPFQDRPGLGPWIWWSSGYQVLVPGKQGSVRTTEGRLSLLIKSETPVREWILSRMDESDEGGARKLDFESVEPVDLEDLGNGQTRMTSRKTLKRGEWCVYVGRPSDGANKSDKLRVYAFGVDRPTPGAKK